MTDGSGSKIDSKIATVTMNIPLAVTQHPKSVSPKKCEKVTFSVKATGKDLSYQWYKKSADSSWTQWNGMTSASVSGTADNSWNGMQVKCTVTDGSGRKVDSNAATVTINVPLAITQQPKSVTANVGEKVTFSVKATGKDLSYQWYYKIGRAHV